MESASKRQTRQTTRDQAAKNQAGDDNDSSRSGSTDNNKKRKFQEFDQDQKKPLSKPKSKKFRGNDGNAKKDQDKEEEKRNVQEGSKPSCQLDSQAKAVQVYKNDRGISTSHNKGTLEEAQQQLSQQVAGANVSLSNEGNSGSSSQMKDIPSNILIEHQNDNTDVQQSKTFQAQNQRIPGSLIDQDLQRKQQPCVIEIDKRQLTVIKEDQSQEYSNLGVHIQEQRKYSEYFGEEPNRRPIDSQHQNQFVQNTAHNQPHSTMLSNHPQHLFASPNSSESFMEQIPKPVLKQYLQQTKSQYQQWYQERYQPNDQRDIERMQFASPSDQSMFNESSNSPNKEQRAFQQNIANQQQMSMLNKQKIQQNEDNEIIDTTTQIKHKKIQRTKHNQDDKLFPVIDYDEFSSFVYLYGTQKQFKENLNKLNKRLPTVFEDQFKTIYQTKEKPLSAADYILDIDPSKSSKYNKPKKINKAVSTLIKECVSSLKKEYNSQLINLFQSQIVQTEQKKYSKFIIFVYMIVTFKSSLSWYKLINNVQALGLTLEEGRCWPQLCQQINFNKNEKQFLRDLLKLMIVNCPNFLKIWKVILHFQIAFCFFGDIGILESRYIQECNEQYKKITYDNVVEEAFQVQHQIPSSILNKITFQNLDPFIIEITQKLANINFIDIIQHIELDKNDMINQRKQIRLFIVMWMNYYKSILYFIQEAIIQQGFIQNDKQYPIKLHKLNKIIKNIQHDKFEQVLMDYMEQQNMIEKDILEKIQVKIQQMTKYDEPMNDNINKMAMELLGKPLNETDLFKFINGHTDFQKNYQIDRYQILCANYLLLNNRSLITLPTGQGKSIIIIMLALYYKEYLDNNYQVYVITTSSILASQMLMFFGELNADIEVQTYVKFISQDIKKIQKDKTVLLIDEVDYILSEYNILYEQEQSYFISDLGKIQHIKGLSAIQLQSVSQACNSIICPSIKEGFKQRSFPAIIDNEFVEDTYEVTNFPGTLQNAVEITQFIKDIKVQLTKTSVLIFSNEDNKLINDAIKNHLQDHLIVFEKKSLFEDINQHIVQLRTSTNKVFLILDEELGRGLDFKLEKDALVVLLYLPKQYSSFIQIAGRGSRLRTISKLFIYNCPNYQGGIATMKANQKNYYSDLKTKFSLLKEVYDDLTLQYNATIQRTVGLDVGNKKHDIVIKEFNHFIPKPHQNFANFRFLYTVTNQVKWQNQFNQIKRKFKDDVNKELLYFETNTQKDLKDKIQKRLHQLLEYITDSE